MLYIVISPFYILEAFSRFISSICVFSRWVKMQSGRQCKHCLPQIIGYLKIHITFIPNKANAVIERFDSALDYA